MYREMKIAEESLKVESMKKIKESLSILMHLQYFERGHETI
jgi:hypothetical protein